MILLNQYNDNLNNLQLWGNYKGVFLKKKNKLSFRYTRNCLEYLEYIPWISYLRNHKNDYN